MNNAKTLKKLRKEAGLTQVQAAWIMSISTRTWQRHEMGDLETKDFFITVFRQQLEILKLIETGQHKESSK